MDQAGNPLQDKDNLVVLEKDEAEQVRQYLRRVVKNSFMPAAGNNFHCRNNLNVGPGSTDFFSGVLNSNASSSNSERIGDALLGNFGQLFQAVARHRGEDVAMQAAEGDNSLVRFINLLRKYKREIFDPQIVQELIDEANIANPSSSKAVPA